MKNEERTTGDVIYGGPKGSDALIGDIITWSKTGV